MKTTKLGYIPRWWLMLCDAIFFGIALFALFLKKEYDFVSFFYLYGPSVLTIASFWFVSGYFFKKYRPFRQSRYIQASGRVFGTTILTLGAALLLAHFDLYRFSTYQSSALVVVVFIQNILMTIVLYSYRYASYFDEVSHAYMSRPAKEILKPSYQLDEAAVKAIEHAIVQNTDRKTLLFLKRYLDLADSNTLVLFTTHLFNIQSVQNYRYRVVVNIQRLNDMRSINHFFCTVNEKVPDGGELLCCFESQETRKKKILTHYPSGINWVVYTADFIKKRVLPKLFITSHLYYDITQGKRRVLSTTEILGRLYYCGFEVIQTAEHNGLTYVLARRKQLPELQIKRRYGPLIKLRRVGKNGQLISFYKLRTMYPYSEYLQKYIYDNYGTQDGDKARYDFRITSWGRFFRRVWIDELPMLLNLLRGDMKLVGVRPLSKTKFDTYPPYLQKKRIQTKPGLLPPFYADMPKTQQEMFDSEERYLEAYFKSPLKTDIIYFCRIFSNIVFHKARSN